MNHPPVNRYHSLLVYCLASTALGAGWCYAASQLPRDHVKPPRINRAAVRRELQDFSLAGMNRRLGPDYQFYHRNSAAEKFPEVWMAPSKQEPGGRRYQIGGPWTKEAGDFSSTQGQALYVPDSGFGVDRVTILEWSNGVFSERPEAPWWGGFRPEPTAKVWQAATKGNPGVPIAMARAMGNWANCGIIIFSSGLVGTAGTVTARGMDPTFQFPPNKVPTAVSITNKSEFALVTVFDTQAKKGQVAVFSLGTNGPKSHFVHEWTTDQSSLPNVGVFTQIKLLGYIDLPGVEFPTSVSAAGNHFGGRLSGRDGNAGLLREYSLAVQADRDTFFKGNNADYSSTAGWAVVASKYENKAAFIDLQPLFQHVREMYLTTEENSQKTRNMGLEPGQWPYTFDVDPSWKPLVITVVDVPQPTAVLASLSGAEKARAFIASQDGTIGIYRVGGLATEAPAVATDVQRVGEVRVGRNPNCLTYQKYSGDTLIAACRGDREIDWVQYSGDTAQVTKRLRDARLLDPVYVEQADTHGIETALITVADFKGRQILNYRYSQLVFATQGGARFGMGPDGKDEFECGGVMELPGSPVCVSATNVN